jgi:hypothetical protein
MKHGHFFPGTTGKIFLASSLIPHKPRVWKDSVKVII